MAATSILHDSARSTSARLRVAHINANFAGGSGGIMLREASAVDSDRYAATILAPGDGPLFDRARDEGVDVIRLRRMGGGRHVYPGADVRALRELSWHLAEHDFDVVHTHAGRAGAIGRLAAHRVGIPAIVHTLHGFPFNEFQNPATRAALCAIERRLGGVSHAGRRHRRSHQRQHVFRAHRQGRQRRTDRHPTVQQPRRRGRPRPSCPAQQPA